MDSERPDPEDWREWRRMQAWRLKQLGWKQRQIAVALGVTEGAVSRWVATACSEGPAALLARPHLGPAAKLEPDQLRLIPDFLSHGAEAYGFRGEVWTCARVAKVIEEEFGVSYHKGHVSRLLKELRWTPQLPIARAIQRDEQKIEQWRVAVWPRLKDEARRERRALVFVDESGFYLLPGKVRTYAPEIRTYVWPPGWRAETGPLLEDHKGCACCTPKTHAPRHDSLGACDFAGTACTRQSLVFATPFANTNTCNWIYRFPANPGNAEGRRPAAHPGLGPWLGARVASPRCPILRPGDLSVAGNTLIGQFPSPRSGPDAWQRSSPASVSSWTCGIRDQPK